MGAPIAGPYDTVVLAGGAARRLSGADKPGLDLDGRSLLARVVAACVGASRIVVVGPEREVPVGITAEILWTTETPPGAGPVAAIEAGLVQTRASLVVVLAADLPWIAPALPVLLAAVEGADVAVLVDASGRRNLLAAAWQRAALEAAVASVPQLAGAAVRQLFEGVHCVEVPDAGAWGQDCDTWEDLAQARERAKQ